MRWWRWSLRCTSIFLSSRCFSGPSRSVLRTFRHSLEKATDSAVLAANQGLYNGFLAAGLVWGPLQGVPAFALQIKIFFLICVIVAGIYGAVTVSRRILYVQALPAAIALILLGLA